MSTDAFVNPQLKSALKTFKMRSPDREVEMDHVRISSVVGAIDAAIQDIVAERAGLVARVKAIVDQPQVTLKWRRRAQSDLSAEEFLRAEQRLQSLALQISDFEFLKASLSKKVPT
ncbi:MAG TPA: hypothetical protein VKS24_21525 [Bradyrhizobium sp.]|nr:hypothetical protein [Bradyrhizobium sp.]